MQSEDRDAVAAAREHLAASRNPRNPLTALPEGFATSRSGFHFIAEQLIKPKRELETGNEIALRFTAGGFGTPPWEEGEASGSPGQARVEGTEVVLLSGGREERRPADDPASAADMLGIDPPELGELTLLGADSAAALADWFAFGTVVLAELIDRHPDLDPAPIRLWPEHFDVATELGSEPDGSRANFGASPGDDEHPEPYLYVGPWNQSVEGDGWNATAFKGAELGHRDLLAAKDQITAAATFLTGRLEALAT